MPDMLRVLSAGHHNLVTGSRYLEPSANEGLSPTRSAVSKIATWLTCQVIGVSVTDPMSGFFDAFRRELLEASAHRLSMEGSKILADILAPTRAKVRVLTSRTLVAGTWLKRR